MKSKVEEIIKKLRGFAGDDDQEYNCLLSDLENFLNWKPCSVALPEKPEDHNSYHVTIESPEGYRSRSITQYILFQGKPRWRLGDKEGKVVAWTELPEPWEGGE